jgi:hypothetical protein
VFRVGNKAWLTTASARHGFPRLQEPRYDARRHTIACCDWGIPLLWLPLFRPEDFVVEHITVESGTTFRDPAPVVEVPVAIARLRKAVPRLNKVFQKQGKLNRHAALMQEALASTRRPFVCLEAEALAWAGDARDFYKRLRRALAYFDAEDTRQGRTHLLYLTPTVGEPDLPFPRKGFEQNKDPEIEDMEMVRFLFGEKWERPVPWECERRRQR